MAPQFKRKFPENFVASKAACQESRVSPGRMFVFELDQAERPKFIINFPTKSHWRSKSRREDVQSGLAALNEEIDRLQISSIAIPPLGCGRGGLAWDQVREDLEASFRHRSEVQVMVFEPIQAT